MTCPNCKTDNPPGSRFCMECGTRLPVTEAANAAPIESPAVSGGTTANSVPAAGEADAGRRPQPPASSPTVVVQTARTLDPVELPPTHPEWRMSPAGPLPEQARRRWVVWLVGAVGACLLVCVTAWVLLGTVFRDQAESFIATQVSIATQTAIDESSHEWEP